MELCRWIKTEKRWKRKVLSRSLLAEIFRMKKTIILEGYISLRGSAGETAALQILEGRMSSNVVRVSLGV